MQVILNLIYTFNGVEFEMLEEHTNIINAGDEPISHGKMLKLKSELSSRVLRNEFRDKLKPLVLSSNPQRITVLFHRHGFDERIKKISSGTFRITVDASLYANASMFDRMITENYTRSKESEIADHSNSILMRNHKHHCNNTVKLCEWALENLELNSSQEEMIKRIHHCVGLIGSFNESPSSRMPKYMSVGYKRTPVFSDLIRFYLKGLTGFKSFTYVNLVLSRLKYTRVKQCQYTHIDFNTFPSEGIVKEPTPNQVQWLKQHLPLHLLAN